MKIFRNLFSLALLLTIALPEAGSAEIEAIKGKRYKLAKNHGPWMVMVAAIRDVPDEDRRTKDGMSAWQAADELVYELRRKGIPAYTYSIEEQIGKIADTAQMGSKRYVAQHGYISVLAGNFSSNTDGKATEVLKYIKTKFNPAFLSDAKNGGILPKTPGRPAPLSRAFLTANPLWEGEIRDAEKDNFLVELNADQEYSLLKCKGKYSLVVASFHGGSVMQIDGRDSAKALGFFEKNFGKSLDECAQNAMTLTNRLRSAKKYGYDQDYEAYVFHDKYRSVVTIGSFNSKDDPRMKSLMTKFGGKYRQDPKTGRDMLVAETFTVPRVTRPGQMPAQEWVFDGECKVISVPRVK